MRGFFLGVLCMFASSFYVVGVKADVINPGPRYRYEYEHHAMDKTEWDREMARLRQGKVVSDRKLMPSLFARMGRWEIIVCYLVPAFLTICFCCLAAKKKIKKMECVVGSVLVCAAAVGVAWFFESREQFEALYYACVGRYHEFERNRYLETQRNVEIKVKVDILVAPRLNESYDQYKTRVRWRNTNRCQECGTMLERVRYYSKYRTICPKCNPYIGDEHGDAPHGRRCTSWTE